MSIFMKHLDSRRIIERKREYAPVNLRTSWYKLSIMYKFLIIFFGVFFLCADFGILNGRFLEYKIGYFTSQSNIWCILYFTVEIIVLFTTGEKGLEKTWCPIIKWVITMCITLTFLVAHFILKTGFAFDSWYHIAGLGLHYLVPILTIGDWLIFDAKGNIKKYYPFIWIIVPYIYFATAILAANYENGLVGGTVSKYPYDFIDIEKYGMKHVLMTLGEVTVIFVILGYLVYGIDSFMFRKKGE